MSNTRKTVRPLKTTSSALNLDALIDEDSPFDFVIGGRTFELPNVNDWPLPAFQALGNTSLLAALRMILGDDVVDQQIAPHLSMRRLKALVDKANAQVGATEGESEASGDS